MIHSERATDFIKMIFIVLFFFIPTSFSTGEQFPKTKLWGYVFHLSDLPENYLEETLPVFSAVSLTGYSISASGKIICSENRIMKNTIRAAKKNRIRLYPVLSFASVQAGHVILNSTEFRFRLADNIKNFIQKYRYNGIHLDFEYLPPDDAPQLATFLKELKNALAGATISLAIFPQLDFPHKWAGFHDLKKISPHIDEIVLMCYDLHRPDTSPGPVTDYSWAEKNITHALKYLDSKKIWLGIPAYGYSWPSKGKASAVSARQGKTLAKKFGETRHQSGNVLVLYQSGGIHYTVFFPDRKTMNDLAYLSEKYNLKGVAIWRLGMEE